MRSSAGLTSRISSPFLATWSCRTACASKSPPPSPPTFRGTRMSAKLRWIAAFGCALLTISCALSAADVPEEAKSSFALGEYPKAIEILNRAAATFPDDAAVQHLLARSYFENEQFDRAVSAAEKSVALQPKNSIYHEWLGHAYGEKADRSGWFSALSLAKKARKEFETAVRLDSRNFSAMQALIEFDCSAP